MAKTKYVGVYIDNNGQYFYETELGTDRITGKRLRKKGRTNQQGRKFTSALQAYKELVRVKNEYHQVNGYGNYHMTYGQDRKSTRLNSSHVAISYAVFCLKKKKQLKKHTN